MTQFGQIRLSSTQTFHYVISGETAPEVYGWVEDDYIVLPETSGWYRTNNPYAAARIAQDLTH